MRNCLALIYSIFFFAMAAPAFAQEPLLLFAPASMGELMNRAAAEYGKESGQPVRVSIAGTAQLARQIEAGAPADVFVSADEAWMDWAAELGLVQPKSRAVIARNRLVIAVRNETENWADPVAILKSGRFSMADAENVPAGRYAKQALTKLGVWEEASKNAAFSENVRVALSRLAEGEVEAAIVYESDLSAEPRVRALFTFDEKLHDPITYLAALTAEAKAGAEGLLAFLTSARFGELSRDAGFPPAAR